MEYKELKKKKENELQRVLAEQRDRLRDLRFKDANKQLKDVRIIRKTRKIISQILMLLSNSKGNLNIVEEKKEEEKEISNKKK